MVEIMEKLNKNYKQIWYKLHTTCDSKKWPSVLMLLFSLPFTTAAVESVFSKLKIITSLTQCFTESFESRV